MEFKRSEQQLSATKTSSKYVRDFESLFVPIKVEQLRDKARSGHLRHCQFRSLCWRYFLRCLPEHYNQWLADCSESRLGYQTIVVKHANLKAALSTDHQPPSPITPTTATTPNNLLLDQEQPVESKLDELSAEAAAAEASRKKELEEEQQYVKAASQCDHKNVLKTIERDVVRTFPDMEFFRQTEMQAILERVLFHYASENPHLSYKQGMHELLATLLYVLHTDSQNCLINYQGGYANDTIATLLDFKYLEHDTYQLFCALMKSLETWYQNDEILTTNITSSSNKQYVSIQSSTTTRSTGSSRQQVTSVLGSKLKMISENIVKNYDIELFNHLEALQIAPQIYGIRWMRLLFGREFEFLDLLIVWDAIICDKLSMSLTDYIFASMLITIREELVNGDYTDCLNNLMRHQFKDVQYVIKLALYLRNPKKHDRPKAMYSAVKKTFSHFQQQPYHQQQHNRKNNQSGETSLTSRLSQRYISVKQQIQQANSRYEQWSNSSGSSHSGAISRVGRNKHLQQHKQQETTTHSNQQYHHNRSTASSSSSALNSFEKLPVREYEMRVMQSTSSANSKGGYATNARRDKLNLGSIYGKQDAGNNMANISSESYEDLHSIVDYCWRLLSEQIDSLQRCLPKEKSLHSEDEIFVALAQLKKVRDVLKGSLKLEDELESATAVSVATDADNRK